MYESGEDYIETIYRLKRKNGSVRSIDVAKELGFSRPSVSRAVSILKKDGYIVVDDTGNLELTDKGKKKATGVYDRHRTLTKFLIETAGVSEKTAEADACRIEHIISESTFRGIKKFMKTQKDAENQAD
ncbi:MAG: metal-dependent transcriptional regulator [Lachnospiraceae bacterium]|nr:metal-dependent transcriptional regulator [Lachnospiraceae bacterium]